MARRAVQQQCEMLADGPLTQPAIAHCVARQMPLAQLLFLGNSMPIRDVACYGLTLPAGTAVVANRGASGIDGTLATAIGFALAQRRPMTALLGDLSVLHDLNSLALGKRLRTPFVLVVINNDGGGIFATLEEKPPADLLREGWQTPHGITFEAAAELFGWEYYAPGTLGQFRRAWHGALEGGRPTVIELRVDAERSLATAHKLHQAVQQQVARIRFE